jgi:hypothetical protein
MQLSYPQYAAVMACSRSCLEIAAGLICKDAREMEGGRGMSGILARRYHCPVPDDRYPGYHQVRYHHPAVLLQWFMRVMVQ